MTTISVGGLTFGSTAYLDANGVEWSFSKTKGWFDGAPAKGGSTDRPGAHGSFAERTWRGSRLVTMTAAVHAPTRRLASDAQRSLAALLAEGTFGDFTVADPDQGTLTASVRGEGDPQIDWYAPCDIDVQLTFLAPDPLRYSSPVTVSTGFPVAGGGLHFPLYTNRAIRLGILSFGARSTTGRILLTNPGNADAWITYTVAGLLPSEGFELAVVGTGQLHRFQGGIPAGSSILVDTARGAETILMDGVSDRSGQMTRMDPFFVPANGSIELQFTNLGTTSAAVLTASLTPGFW